VPTVPLLRDSALSSSHALLAARGSTIRRLAIENWRISVSLADENILIHGEEPDESYPHPAIP